MSYFFTADTHFGHESVITYCDRPFDSVEEMDEALIQNWNEKVGPSDTVYHLGDFSWHGMAETYRRRLNGNINLILGNHDKQIKRGDPLFGFVKDTYMFRENDIHLFLCHYAMRTWPKKHYGAIQLFGHSHGSLSVPEGCLQMDVGVDCHDYAPISLEQVLEHFDMT